MLFKPVLIRRSGANHVNNGPHLARGLVAPAKLMEHQAEVIMAFSVGGTVLEEALERLARVLVLTGLEIGEADLPPHFVLAVMRVLSNNSVKEFDGLGELRLFASNSAQVIMSVDFVRSNFYCALEAYFGLFELPVLFVNKAEIVMSRGVSRIQGRGLQTTPEPFSVALGREDIAQYIP